MNKEIVNYFQKALLENPRRILNGKGEIIEIYNQPERSKREDHKPKLKGRMYINSEHRNWPDGCGALNTDESQ